MAEAFLQTVITVEQGPDGHPWLAITTRVFGAQFTAGVPAKHGEAWLSNIQQQMRAAMRAAKQMETGLVVASSIPKQNGKQ